MSDCIFCKIVKGEIPSYTIYEDDIVKIFLDIHPISKGHCLMIPKKHKDNLMDIDLETLNHMDKVAKQMYVKLKETLGCEGITRVQNNERGQEVKHYHMHFIPRYPNDTVVIKSSATKELNIEEIYKKIHE